MLALPPRRPLAGAAAFTAGVLLLAACGGGAGGSGGGGGDDDTLVLAWSSTPTQVDPSVYTGLSWICAGDAHMATLVDYSVDVPEDELVSASDLDPGLAESWEPSADQTQYTVRLRQGVQSSAGNELTADDVIYTFDRLLSDPSTLTAAIFFPTANVDAANPWTKIDDHTLTYNLLAPSAIAMSILAYPAHGILDSQEVDEHATADDPWGSEWLATHSASFDGYQISSIDPGAEIRWTRNANFWGEPPAFDEIVARAVPDGSARVQLLVSGEVDQIDQPPTELLESIRSSSTARISSMPDTNRHNLTFNNADPVLADRRVRVALSHAIDRQAIVDSVYQGFATPATTPESSAVLADQPQVGEHDPDLARQLLAEAGRADGFDLQLAYNTSRPGPYAETIARLVQDDLAQVGVRVTLDAVPSLADFEAGVSDGTYQSYLYTERPSQPDVVFAQYSYLFGSSSLNKSGYDNATFDQLTLDALSLPTGPERDQAVAGALAELANDQPIAQLVEVPDVVGLSTALEGYRASPVGGVPFRALSKN